MAKRNDENKIPDIKCNRIKSSNTYQYNRYHRTIPPVSIVYFLHRISLDHRHPLIYHTHEIYTARYSSFIIRLNIVRHTAPSARVESQRLVASCALDRSIFDLQKWNVICNRTVHPSTLHTHAIFEICLALVVAVICLPKFET